MKIAIALVVAWCLAVPAAADESVLDVVRAEFSGWDRDRDGNLTVEEVDRAMGDPSVRGAAAAALAVIKALERRNSDREEATPPITLAQLAELEASHENGEAGDDDYEAWFREYQEKLGATSRELFPQDVPRLNRIKQGDLGDCFCVAMIGSLVHRDANAFVRMISRNSDGTYAVGFPGLAPVTVTPPTDTEIAINSSARENGLWLTVFEKAIGTVAHRLTPPAKRTAQPTDSIAYGGLAGDAIALFTGHGVADVERDDKELGAALVAGIQGACLMYSVMRLDVHVPEGLINGHVYAVVGYDAATRSVRIFDPRGLDHQPEGEPGPEHGYAMKDGVFTVSLDDFAAVFDGVGIEDKNTAAAK